MSSLKLPKFQVVNLFYKATSIFTTFSSFPLMRCWSYWSVIIHYFCCIVIYALNTIWIAVYFCSFLLIFFFFFNSYFWETNYIIHCLLWLMEKSSCYWRFDIPMCCCEPTQHGLLCTSYYIFSSLFVMILLYFFLKWEFQGWSATLFIFIMQYSLHSIDCFLRSEILYFFVLCFCVFAYNCLLILIYCYLCTLCLQDWVHDFSCLNENWFWLL